MARIASLPVVCVAALTLIGFAIRLANIDQSFIGDELSTLWILQGNGLGEVLSSIRSNDEITPPLYFVLGWVSMNIGSDPEWVRLPSLLAGTIMIPFVYLLGARTIGRRAGLIGAAVITLSPFMIYYSTEARAYAVMMALLTGSTLALLAAVETRRARWWAVYALCSLGALYSHYTSAFPLAAQFAWVLWAHRDAVRPLFLANLGVLLGFAPWIPGFIADNTSPTTEILSRLIPFTFEGIRISVEGWAIGYPYVQLDEVPGNLATTLLAAGFLLAVIAAAIRAVGALRRAEPGIGMVVRRASPGAILIALLALATPVGEILFSAVGSDIIGGRNLNPSWPGLAVAIGGLLTAAGPVLGVACTAAVLSGYAIGAVKALDADAARIDTKGPAGAIEERWSPGDVVIDAIALTPVPLTSLDVFLPQTHPEFRLGLPVSDKPFMIGDPIPPPTRLMAEALRSGRGGSIFLVAPLSGEKLVGSVGQAAALREERETNAAKFLRLAKPRFKVTYQERFPGLAPVAVIELQDQGAQAR